MEFEKGILLQHQLWFYEINIEVYLLNKKIRIVKQLMLFFVCCVVND